MSFNCFICNIEKTEFSKIGVNFHTHTESEHNLWDYINFIVHLETVNEKDFNGTESYVFKKFKAKDISWFPINQAISLIDEDEGDDDREKLERFETFLKIVEQRWLQLVEERVAQTSELAK